MNNLNWIFLIAVPSYKELNSGASSDIFDCTDSISLSSLSFALSPSLFWFFLSRFFTLSLSRSSVLSFCFLFIPAPSCLSMIHLSRQPQSAFLNLSSLPSMSFSTVRSRQRRSAAQGRRLRHVQPA
jgi:hypothetical protein